MHELADRLVVLDRGEVVSVIRQGEMSLAELTRHLLELQSAREGAAGAMMRRRPRVQIEGLPIIGVLLVLIAIVHDRGARRCFSATASTCRSWPRCRRS